MNSANQSNDNAEFLEKKICDNFKKYYNTFSFWILFLQPKKYKMFSRKKKLRMMIISFKIYLRNFLSSFSLLWFWSWWSRLSIRLDLNTCLINTCLINTSLINTCLINTRLINTCLINTCLINTCLINTCLINTSLINTFLIKTCLMNTC